MVTSSIETIQEGQQGNNIKLTIDLAFQDGVNAILKKYFESELSTEVHCIRKVFMQLH